MSDSQQGPLSVAQLLATWVGAVDDSYALPFTTAGEGAGLEAYTQAFAQYARASQAIDTTTQACFILPWSGQTAPPAAGPALATVTLTFTRTTYLNVPVRIAAGQVYVEENATDWSATGSTQVLTGRRYTLQTDVIFLPGESGPITAVAQAEFPGYGYNNPQPGSISAFSQPGTEFNNTGALLQVAVAGAVPPAQPPPTLRVTLTAADVADMFVPDHIGQYVKFLAGPNAGIIARVSDFIAPNVATSTGSGVVLEQMVVVESSTATTGTFQLGELVEVLSGATVVGWGTFLVQRASPTAGHVRTAFVLLSGAVAPGNTLLGQQSAATAPVSLVLWNPAYTAPDAAASWTILDWTGDLKIAVANALQPAGGLLGMLDGLGAERNLPRHVGEQDAAYRQRIWQVSDVVTPNAIKRAIIRNAEGLPFCFLEVGSEQFPGFYLDVDALDYNLLSFTGNFSSIPFGNPGPQVGQLVAYQNSLGQTLFTSYLGTFSSAGHTATLTPRDLIQLTVNAGDQIVSLQPNNPWNFQVTTLVADSSDVSNRYHLILDYEEFRGFFLVGLPILDWGEFGCAYDAHPNGFYDQLLPQNPNFYDGYPVNADAFYTGIYQAVDKVRAGGVAFDIVQDPYPCPT